MQNNNNFINNYNSLILAVIYNNAEIEKLQILKNNKERSGIYIWTHKESRNLYIDSAINLKTRLLQYYNIHHLECNKSMYIYNALRNHGYSVFSFSTLEYIDISNLSKEDARKLILEREQYYLDFLVPQYNILKIAGSQLSIYHTE